MQPVTRMTVVYDPSCELCTRAKEWIRQLVPLVSLQFVAAESATARKRFRQLPGGELAVIANTGEAWFGNHAWIVCLWALRGYRELAFRLTSPLLLLMAREAFTVVSENRHALSSLLRLQNEREIEQQLRKVVVPKCQIAPK
jgi:predicted DCC family thiol-disulfide oxidoreductase YuxK